MRLHTYAAAMWQTMFTIYCTASLRDIGISQRANPVQNGSTCIVAGDAAGRACTNVAQHKSLHKLAWRSRKSLQKRGAAQECAQEGRAKIIVTEQTEQDDPNSAHRQPWKQH